MKIFLKVSAVILVCFCLAFLFKKKLENNEMKAYCDSVNGHYGNGKCFIAGMEVNK